MAEHFFSRKYLAVIVLALFIGWSLTMPIPFLGGVSLVLYLVVCGRAAERVLIESFSFAASRRTLIIGIFLSFFTLGLWLSLLLAFTTLSPLWYVLALTLNGIVWCASEKYVVRRVLPQLSIDDEGEVEMKEPQGFGVHAGIFMYAVLYITGIIMLYQSRTGAQVVTPWQVINPHYIFVFLAATLVLGWLSLTRLSVRTTVVLFMFHLFLMHAYLPLTHQLFYGADGWRHLANISLILDQQPLVTTTLSEPAGPGARFGVLAYGQLWGLLALLVQITGVTTTHLLAWFLPVVWAIVFPSIMAELAGALSLGRRGTFYLLWSTLFAYALTVAGSFTLPVSLGLLGWLVMTVLILKRLADPRRDQVPMLGWLGVGLLFGYSLHAVLFWFGWMVAEAVRTIGHRVMRAVAVFVACVGGMMVLPVIEWVLHYTAARPVEWLASVKQVVGTLTGWYIASGPRPHDIATGNIFINQTPASAFVPNVFTLHHGWLVIVGVVIAAGALIGTLYSVFHKQVALVWLGILNTSLTGSYIVSRYFLAGEQVFTRRLDGVLAVLWCVMIVLVLRYLDRQWANRPRYIKLLPLVLILDAVVISALYTLGPDTGTVSVPQVQAMEYVWQVEKDQTKHCVVADTYPLLALEALSRKQIIGGGFPINQYFAQPELAAAFQLLQREAVWGPAFTATKASQCWYVGDTKAILFPPEKIFDNVRVWRTVTK